MFLSFPIDGEHILVSGLYTDSSSPLAREAAYRLFLYPDERQNELLKDLLACRHELARTCEFETYAHRALKSSTVEHPSVVDAFLTELSSELRSRSERDFSTMHKIKVNHIEN